METIKPISLSRAIEAHLLWCESANYSRNTLADYRVTFRHFTRFIDPRTLLADIDAVDVQQFMATMRATPVRAQRGVAHGQATRQRSAKTLLNYHTALGSLWTWAVAHGYAAEHVVRDVPAPRVHRTPLQPLTGDQVAALLRACDRTRAWRTRSGTTSRRVTATRDRAIIGLLVECVPRASELVALRVRDVQFVGGGGVIDIVRGKGGRRRQVPFRRRVAGYLQAWQATRPTTGEPGAPLFVNVARNPGLALNRDGLYKLVKRLGVLAGVEGVGPHRLRTTGACLMVQNGMTAFELQRVMGHASIETTMRYVEAARVDLPGAMQAASPIDRLRL